MAPTERGRFCGSCRKEVVDFSMMTDAEVLNFFSHTTDENVCGRALPSQLNRVINYSKEPKKRLFWYWNYIVMFFMLFSKNNVARAQGTTKHSTEMKPVKQPRSNASNGEVIVNQRVITGKVIDRDGNPVPFAIVKLRAQHTGVSADSKGEYTIRVAPIDILLISGAGFKEKEVAIGSQKHINTVLERSPVASLGEVVVTVAGGIRRINRAAKPEIAANFLIKDELTLGPLGNAKIIVQKKNTEKADSLLTNANGSATLRNFQDKDHLFVKVEADGYAPTEFEITGKQIVENKKQWEVLLQKKSVATKRAEGDSLFIIDGAIAADVNHIDPADIAEISVLLQDPMKITPCHAPLKPIKVITTRKSKTKTLDTVNVNSGKLITCSMTTGTVRVVRVSKVITNRNDGDRTMLAGSMQELNPFPNPVPRGSTMFLPLTINQPGTYEMLVYDSQGKLLLRKNLSMASGKQMESLPTDSRWSGGMYQLSVVDGNKKIIGKCSFIVL